MKVLLVEDDENKRSHIQGFLQENYENITIVSACSLNSGVSKAIEERPDLVLLDMTLPNFDVGPDENGGQHHIFGGHEFIRQMDRRKVNTKILVITQFETFGKPPHIINLSELNQMLTEESPEKYIGAIYYHASIKDWATLLSEKIMELNQ